MPATRRQFGPAPPCCCRSDRRPGRTCSFAPCSPNNCSGQRRSLPITPIIGKVEAMTRLALMLSLAPLLLAASAPVQPTDVPLDAEVRQARAEQAAAEAETAKLDRAAAQANGQ